MTAQRPSREEQSHFAGADFMAAIPRQLEWFDGLFAQAAAVQTPLVAEGDAVPAFEIDLGWVGSGSPAWGRTAGAERRNDSR